jgi:hypothetical protein
LDVNCWVQGNALIEVKGGRKRQMTDSKIKSAKKLLASGVPPRDVASNLGVSVPIGSTTPKVKNRTLTLCGLGFSQEFLFWRSYPEAITKQ